jgi:DNA-nicking Smr family endonuclease
MSNKGKTMKDSDLSLWDKIKQTIRPIHPQSEKVQDRKQVKRPVKTIEKKPVPPRTKTTISSSDLHKPILDKKVVKNIRKGKIIIDARLDLHGMTQDRAEVALKNFVMRCFNQHKKCVLVITGKGTNSKADDDVFSSKRGGVGILKSRFPDWISKPPLNSLVSGYSEAGQSHGGAGAYYLYLKKPSL